MYIIVNMIGTQPETSFPGWEILKFYRPSLIHLRKEDAEEEIIRLHKLAPHCHFVLFEGISEIKEDKFILEKFRI